MLVSPAGLRSTPQACLKQHACMHADLTGPPSSSPTPPVPTTYQRVVFNKEGVSIAFAFSKPPGQPAVTDISASISNNGSATVAGFVLQVRPGVHPMSCLSWVSSSGVLKIPRLH